LGPLLFARTIRIPQSEIPHAPLLLALCSVAQSPKTKAQRPSAAFFACILQEFVLESRSQCFSLAGSHVTRYPYSRTRKFSSQVLLRSRCASVIFAKCGRTSSALPG